jgi:hypothetical protein
MLPDINEDQGNTLRDIHDAERRAVTPSLQGMNSQEELRDVFCMVAFKTTYDGVCEQPNSRRKSQIDEFMQLIEARERAAEQRVLDELLNDDLALKWMYKQDGSEMAGGIPLDVLRRKRQSLQQKKGDESM